MASPPPAINYILSFVLVGLAWGLTTPFIRRAARRRQQSRPAAAAAATAEDESSSSMKNRLWSACVSVWDFVRDPSYSLPLLLNLSGSLWFFLLVGRAASNPRFRPSGLGFLLVELSLTVPIVNTLAFLFTVLGEWFVEGKVISKRTASGVVLSLAGIALCVHSKT
ncbi:hypothetical protein L249_0931 [Ophiocordyceps polyrhachis-furcata BCC 54312]|uniref:Uncharacterized protein n=1 Tax=Ophiocordyceps polyrhachis-furcata BCC 54312 TaxID=1330021 RepID=A0A367LES8_9HYPO|nr:hypothetical protein L249_0931 [Ophiocordyceps polyrhachis-furcata BCC 54312]